MSHRLDTLFTQHLLAISSEHALYLLPRYYWPGRLCYRSSSLVNSSLQVIRSDWIRHTDEIRFNRQAQIRDDVTEYYPTGDNEKRDVEAIDYYYTGDGQKRDDHCSDYYYTGDNEKRDDDCTDYYYTDDNEKRHEARSFVGLELEELD